MRDIAGAGIARGRELRVGQGSAEDELLPISSAWRRNRASQSLSRSSRTTTEARRAWRPTSRTCDSSGSPARTSTTRSRSTRRTGRACSVPGDAGARADGQRHAGAGRALRRRLHLRRRHVRAGLVRVALRAGAQGRPALRPSSGLDTTRCARRATHASGRVTPERPTTPCGSRDRAGSRPDHDHELQRVARRDPDRAGDDVAPATADERSRACDLTRQAALFEL